MKKILIVDDDPVIRNYLDNLLRDNGYETAMAEDAKQAFELLNSQSFDLITLDLELPGEWGSRFFSKLDRDKQKKNIPVIVISGLTGNKYAVRKAVATFNKPFDREELLKVVRDTIET
jgi:DNA-binding response OmpR family regulator